MKKRIYFILAIVIFLIILILGYLAIFGRALRQSENHFGIILILPKVIFSSEAVAIDNQKYLAKNTTAFIKTMGRQGLSYIEQMGSGYILEKDGNHYLSSSRMYSSYFMTFTVPTIVKNNNIEQPAENNYRIADISDTACSSDNDCKTPTKYLIQSSCRYASKCIDSRCAVICPNTVDAEWLKISQAIADCEVVSVMQTHHQEVTARLKDGRELKTFQPSDGDIIDLSTQAQEKCGKIIMATE